MAKLEDTQIRGWVKNNVRFDAKADGNGLYLRYRPTDKLPMWFFRFKIAKIAAKRVMQLPRFSILVPSHRFATKFKYRGLLFVSMRASDC